MSTQGKTHLIDFVIGRPTDDNDGASDDKSQTPKWASTPYDSLRRLADRYAQDLQWRDGKKLLAPILTGDGWRPYHREVRRAFRDAAQAANLEYQDVRFSLDLFHLINDLQKEARSARNILEYQWQKRRNKALEEASHLKNLASTILQHNNWDAFAPAMAEFRLGVHTFSMIQGQGDVDVSDLNPYPVMLRALRQMLGLKTRYSSPTDTQHWPLLPQTIEEEHKKLTEYLAEKHLAIFEHVSELLKCLISAGRDFLTAGPEQMQALARWEKALQEYDACSWTRVEDGGFSFSDQDRRWARGRGPGRLPRFDYWSELRLASEMKYVETRPLDLTPLQSTHPDLHAQATRLLEHFKEPVNTQVLDGHINQHVSEARHVNQRLTEAGSSPLFIISRPSNARTERLNGTIRNIVANSSSNIPFDMLRTRLLYRLSDLTASTAEEPADIPLFPAAAPVICPHCESKELTRHENQEYETLWLDLPIGWRPTRYRTHTPRWTCRTCKSTTPRTTNARKAKRMPALETYLLEIASKPRLSSLPISIWHRRTGAPRAVLRNMFSGPNIPSTPVPDGPALVVALSVTSDQRVDKKEKLQPRVLLTNLRHHTTPLSSTNKKPLLPAKPIVHERMNINGIIAQLTALHRAADRQLLILADGWIPPEWVEKLTDTSQGRWRLARDVHSALPLVKSAARETYEYWKNNTRTRIVKESRRLSSGIPSGTIKSRKENESEMHALFGIKFNETPDQVMDGRVQALSPLCSNLTNEPDFNPQDLTHLRNYLHNWWLALRESSKRNLTREEVDNAFQNLLEEPPKLRAQELQRILARFLSRMRAAIPLLLNTKPIPGEGMYPNTKTGHFHTAQLGAIKAQIKLESIRRGHNDQ